VVVYEEEKLGSGSFGGFCRNFVYFSGAVVKGKYNSQWVALKKLHKGEDEKNFMKEAKLMQAVRFPTCVTFFGIFLDAKGDSYMVTELMDGDLRSFLNKNSKRVSLADKIRM
jgi:serine/threonine protein kinase